MKSALERMLLFAFVLSLMLTVLDALPTGIVAKTATAAVYVHEKSDTPVPSSVLAAINTLNRKGIVATITDDDVTDGGGETPDQYKAAVAAAKEAGLPALVVLAGSDVLRVVKNPQSAAAVLEAVQ